MTNFKRPTPRFNRQLATEGRWFYIVDDATDFSYGGFKCGHYDTSIPRVKIVEERTKRAENLRLKEKRTNTEEAGIRANAEAIVESCILDWDMTGEDGKAIKYSPQKAVEYFCVNYIDSDTGEVVFPHVYTLVKLMHDVTNPRNFQTPEQVEAGEPLGN